VLIQVLVFCYTICTFAAAADSLSKAYGFLVIWSTMITLALSAGGTMVLRRVDYRTHLAVGFLIGVSFMEANLMLIVSVISGANMSRMGGSAGAALPSSASATETFAAMLFIAYSTLTFFIFSWKDILLPATIEGASVGDSGMPPAAYGNGQYGGGGGVIGDGQFHDQGVGSAAGSTSL